MFLNLNQNTTPHVPCVIGEDQKARHRQSKLLKLCKHLLTRSLTNTPASYRMNVTLIQRSSSILSPEAPNFARFHVLPARHA